MPKCWIWPNGTICDEFIDDCADILQPAVVIPTADWLRLVAYFNAWKATCPCDGHCEVCAEDREIAAIVAKVEAGNG